MSHHHLFRCCLIGMSVLLPCVSEADDTFTFCLKWRVETTDSGRTVTLPEGGEITEDHWATDKAKDRTAHGVLFTVSRAGFNNDLPLAIFANPKTGCGSFTDAIGSHVYLVRAYTISMDASSNLIQVVSASGLPFGFDQMVQAGPGTTNLPSFPRASFGIPLSEDAKARATLAAVTAFSAYRLNFGLVGKRMDIAEGPASSAHGSGAYLDALGDGYIKIVIKVPSPADNRDDRRMKFIVGHEMGHAWLLLHHAKGKEPAVDLTYDASGYAGAGCFYEAKDSDQKDQTYTIDSLEYNSVGFREGSAHFYAARVWNNPEPEGVFTWFGNSVYSLARYDNPDLGGGRTFQGCGEKPPICSDNLTTNQDWMRFWWAWHTTGAKPVTTTTIRNVYDKTLDNGGLEKDNYRQMLGAAVLESVRDGNQKLAFSLLADWHGISSGENSRCP